MASPLGLYAPHPPNVREDGLLAKMTPNEVAATLVLFSSQLAPDLLEKELAREVYLTGGADADPDVISKEVALVLTELRAGVHHKADHESLWKALQSTRSDEVGSTGPWLEYEIVAKKAGLAPERAWWTLRRFIRDGWAKGEGAWSMPSNGPADNAHYSISALSSEELGQRAAARITEAATGTAVEDHPLFEPPPGVQLCGDQ